MVRWCKLRSNPSNLQRGPEWYNAAQAGWHTFTITGNSFGFTGPTLLEAGKLSGLPLQVVRGIWVARHPEHRHRVGGHGYVGAIQGSGTVAPGNSIGTLRVTSNADLTASTLDTEIDAATSTSDLLK